MIKRWIGACLLCFFCFIANLGFAQENDLGQILQIHTDLCSIRGRPSWALIIRDVDRGINIPYLYDFDQPQNFWLALSQTRNYLIKSSRLKYHIYSARENRFREYVVNNFCGLESNGRIIHGNSFSIRITGDLKPYSETLVCNVSQYFDPMALKAMGNNL